MWDEQLEKQLIDMEALFNATRGSIQFLKASRHFNVTPQELSVRIAAMEKKQTASMERIIDCAILLGGHVKRTKPVNGIVYAWQIHVPSYHREYTIVFDFARVDDPEIYDLALSHQFWITHKKRPRTRFYVYDRGYNDCESVPEFRKDVKTANKYLAEQLK